MPFGKYKGLTLREIWKIDYLYMDWLMNKVRDKEITGPVGNVISYVIENITEYWDDYQISWKLKPK